MPQIHGGNLKEISRQYGISEKEILDFSANINPIGPPRSALKAILEEMEGLVHYPDIDALTLRESLARVDRMKVDHILAGNGSSEFIYLVPRVLQPATALVLSPTYSDYERALTLAGCQVIHFPLRQEDEFIFDVQEFMRSIRQGADLVILCNPNNPTGSLIPKQGIMEILELSQELDVIVVVDEAFMDFVPGESVRFQVMEFDHLLVLRSLTKFYGIPGLRAGCLYGSRDLIDRIREFKEPWTLNRLSQAAMIAAFSDEDYRQTTMNLIVEERGYLSRELEAIPGIQVFPSCANFLLLKTTPPMPEADRLFETMLGSGILVRSCASFSSLGPSFIRVAIRNHDENLLLVEALRKAVRTLL